MSDASSYPGGRKIFVGRPGIHIPGDSPYFSSIPLLALIIPDVRWGIKKRDKVGWRRHDALTTRLAGGKMSGVIVALHRILGRASLDSPQVFLIIIRMVRWGFDVYTQTSYLHAGSFRGFHGLWRLPLFADNWYDNGRLLFAM